LKPAQIEKYDEPDYSKLFTGNISPKTTKEELFDFFQKYGSVADVFVPIDFTLRRGKGFAFVEFEDRKSAETVLSLSSKLKFGDRFLYIKWAIPKQTTIVKP